MNNEEVILLERLLGEPITIYFRTLNPIAAALASSGQIYTYVNDATYINTLKANLPEGMKIYWLEILGRAHLAASTGIFRQLRWLTATATLAQTQNFLGFSSALRGLLESSADAHDGLAGVPGALAAMFSEIQKAVQGRLEQRILSSELEEKLIHFAFARRPRKSETGVPSAHVAKSAADYNRQLESSGSKRIADFYKTLCEVTHPGASSVYAFIRQVDQDHEVLDPSGDLGLIKGLCDEFRPEVDRLLQMGTNPMLLTLKVLNEFAGTGLFTEPVASLGLSGIPGWVKCKAKIDATQAAGK